MPLGTVKGRMRLGLEKIRVQLAEALTPSRLWRGHERANVTRGYAGTTSRRLRARRPRRARDAPGRRARRRGCESCRERVRWLAPAVDVLPASVPPLDPPPELRSGLMEIVEREAAEAERVGAGRQAAPPVLAARLRQLLPAPGAGRLRHRAPARRRSRRLRAARRRATPSPRPSPRPRPSERSIASGDARGRRRRGHAARSRTCPRPDRDEVYQAWVQTRPGTDGRIVPSSVFVVYDDGTGRGLDPARPRRRGAGHGHPRAGGRQREADRERRCSSPELE